MTVALLSLSSHIANAPYRSDTRASSQVANGTTWVLDRSSQIGDNHLTEYATRYIVPPEAQVTTTQTTTIVSIHSYTTTSTSTTSTTTTSTTMTTRTLVTVSTLLTTTTTTTTSISLRVQTSTSTVRRTTTSTVILEAPTTTTTTRTSTSLYPTTTITSTRIHYENTTVYSPTVTVTSTETSVIRTTSQTTASLTKTTTAETTVTVLQPCVIASAAYGSELAPEVQFLRTFRDKSASSTMAGSNFMKAFNRFYYSFSPKLASILEENHLLSQIIRLFLHPFVKVLQMASSVFYALSFAQELAISVCGIVASALVGLLCLVPVLGSVKILLFCLDKKNKRS